MSVQLMRSRLSQLYGDASDAHLGLLLQHGLEMHDEGSKNKTKLKLELIERVCKTDMGDLYRGAYKRWREATSDKSRFRINHPSAKNPAVRWIGRRRHVGNRLRHKPQLRCAVHPGVQRQRRR